MFALTVPAQPECVAVISAFIWAIAYEANLNDGKAYRLRLAVDEVVTNIIHYGHVSHSVDGSIALWVELTSQAVSVTIRDTGIPYDLTQQPPPDDLHLPLDKRQTGGLGVYLVTRFVDSVRYERVGRMNINRLTVRLGE